MHICGKILRLRDMHVHDACLRRFYGNHVRGYRRNIFGLCPTSETGPLVAICVRERGLLRDHQFDYGTTQK